MFLARMDVSEKCISIIIRVTRICDLGTELTAVGSPTGGGVDSVV
jgi:hypothetical protein